MKKILKMTIPVAMSVSFYGEFCECKLPEVILDLERQLNNLKLLSEAIPIGMYPRFHLSGDGYDIISTGACNGKGRPHGIIDKRKDICVSSGLCKDHCI